MNSNNCGSRFVRVSRQVASTGSVSGSELTTLSATWTQHASVLFAAKSPASSDITADALISEEGSKPFFSAALDTMDDASIQREQLLA